MTKPTERIRFAGDVALEKVEIISSNGFVQNIANQVITLQVFEDMFSPFISGNIIFKDSLDLVNLFPFVGEETVNLRIKTPTFGEKEGIIEGSFYVYKLTERELLGDRSVLYMLHFISFESIVDVNKKISRTLQGKISDIAKDIITKPEYLQTKRKVNIEETNNKLKYISNFWSPVKNLNYLASNAVNKKNSPTYLFFENRDGFNFVSMETILAAPVIQDFVYDAYSRDIKKDGTSNKNLERDYKRIQEISIPTGFDYIQRGTAGMYASKLITHDITTKRYSTKNFDMLENFPKNSHMNAYPIASKKNIARSNSFVLPYNKYYGNFDQFGDVTNANTIQARMSLLQQLESFRVQVTVPGRTDYTVGRKVKLKLNKMEPIAKDENSDKNVDKMFSGTYVIAAINHYFDKEKHECNMELIKDSLEMDLDRNGK